MDTATPRSFPCPASDLLDAAAIEEIGARFDRLRVFAECYTDAQQFRISIGNRVGGAARRHIAVPPDSIDPILDVAARSEAEWKKALRNAYRVEVPEPIRRWQAESRGIGEHGLARLLGTLGHPVLAFPHYRDNGELVGGDPYLRNVGKLWAYAGFGDPTLRRRRGMAADDALALGNQRLKTLVWLLAVAAMKQGDTTVPGHTTSETHRRSAGGDTPVPDTRLGYRGIYDQGRARYATRDWTAGHQHAAALRLVAKAILKDLWIAGVEHLTTC